MKNLRIPSALHGPGPQIEKLTKAKIVVWLRQFKSSIQHKGENMRTFFLAICVLMANMANVHATFTIHADPGGQIGDYMERYENLAKSGERVVVDGPCYSACTILLGYLQPNQVCATPKARFGFHAAWHASDREVARAGTQLLMKIYPEKVRSWIALKGGLNGNLLYAQATQFIPACTRESPATPVQVRSKRALPKK